jgi:peptidoglycan/xylan/chitin deacetylase (PgdA/CDA1 family)
MLYDHPRSAEHMSVLAHQAYDPLTGVPRLLRILEREGVRGTFFVPGFSADRWPDTIRSIRDAGHEIGHHGYLHEPIHDVDEATEEGYLARGLEALDRVLGVRPTGYRAPKFKLNFRTAAILARNGIRYDSSLQDSDWPYRLAGGPEADAPAIVEIPVQWPLDDWSHFGYLPGLLPATTIANPRNVLDLWTLELEALVEEGGCFVLTLHPYLSGRASRARIVQELIERMRSIEGLWVATTGEIAKHAEAVELERRWHRPVDVPEHAAS